MLYFFLAFLVVVVCFLCRIDFISFVFYCSSKWLFDWRDWSDDTDEPLFQFDSEQINLLNKRLRQRT